MLLRPLASTIGLILALASLSVTLWIVIPALSLQLWMVSVAASEWSLWFGLLGLLGTLVGAAAVRLGGHLAGPLAMACGVIAMALALVPAVQAVQAARHEGVTLSIRRYFLGARPNGRVEEIHDVTFAAPTGQALQLDIYRPISPGGRVLPALLIVHGGGWNGGTKGEFRPQSRALAAEGFVVFDVDYRLAGPEARFPAQVADVECAIGWVKRNAATYGVDPRRIGLLGRSAGANVVLLAAYTSANPAAGCPDEDISVQAVVSFYAPVDLAWGYEHPARPDIYNGPIHLRNYLGGTPATDPATYRLASPNYRVSRSAPPTLVLHGERDPIVNSENARFLDAALGKVGVPHRIVLLPWATHGFDFPANGWSAQIAGPIVVDFLHSYLRGAGKVVVRDLRPQ